MHRFAHLLARHARLLSLPLLAGGLGACVPFFGGGGGPTPARARLTEEVREVLNTEDPSARFFRERARLQAMGRELDDVLVGLVRDPSVDEKVRANAAILLADRRAPAALPVLRRLVLRAPDDAVRAGAVIGLWKLAPEHPDAARALRAAIGDPAARVRLNVVQALDVEDAVLLRRHLRAEQDPQVREIGMQFLVLFESRGAPLGADASGDRRTAGPDSLPRIVFHPMRADPPRGLEAGALWVERRGGGGLVPLAQKVEVVAGVVPAFFDRARTAVVFEAEREIRVRDLRSGETRVVGPGVAPRVVPFTDRFVFLRPHDAAGEPREDGGVVLRYEVLRGSFAGPGLESMGTLTAVARPERHGSASPARWMVIGEVREGFVLRGEGIAPFLLPNPFDGAPGTPPPAP